MSSPTASPAPSVRTQGPSALGGSLRRFVELTLTLARTDFKLRYFGSALGYFWQLARPLLFFGVIYVAFTKIFDVDKGVPHYGVYLLTGIVLWTFYGEATGNAISSLTAREPLLRKVRFPRLAIPIAVTMTSVFNLLMNSIAVIVFALANGVYPSLSWLWMLPVILGFIIIALGTGMLLSALYVRYRDVQPIWEVTLQILFYATPIMYPAYKFKSLEHIALLNPFAMMLTQMGYAFVHPGRIATKVAAAVSALHPGTVAVRVAGKLVLHPGTVATIAPAHTVYTEPMRSAAAASGGALHVAIAIAIIPLVFALGLWFFHREAPRFAENL
jgi:ABC-2 type transport system permease protein